MSVSPAAGTSCRLLARPGRRCRAIAPATSIAAARSPVASARSPLARPRIVFATVWALAIVWLATAGALRAAPPGPKALAAKPNEALRTWQRWPGAGTSRSLAVLKRRILRESAARKALGDAKPLRFDTDLLLPGGAGDGGGAGGGAIPCDEICRAGVIECGAPVTGNLAAGDCAIGDGSFIEAWTFELDEPREVSIRYRSADFDCYLFVAGQDGCIPLAQNDDCGVGDLNSCLDLSLDRGTYFILPNTYAPEASGDYELEVNCAEPVCLRCASTELSCDSLTTGELAETDCSDAGGAAVDLYRLDVAARSPITVEVSSFDFDTIVAIYSQSCGTVAANDDCAPQTLNSCIRDVALDPGSYVIAVSSFDDEDLGEYLLRVACADVSFCNGCTEGPLSCGAPAASGSLTAEDCSGDGGARLDLYTLDLAEQSTVDVRLAGTGIEGAELALFGSTCQRIALPADCEDGSCVLRGLAPGGYWIGVEGPAAAGSSYELSADCRTYDFCSDCSVGSLGCGESTTGSLSSSDCDLGDGSFADTWRLELAKPAFVTITLSSPDFDTYLFLADGGCGLVAENDDAAGTNSAIGVQLPAGTYWITANSFDPGASGDYGLAVECGDNPLCSECVVGTVGCSSEVGGDLAASDCVYFDGTFIDLYRLEVPVAGPVSIRMQSDFDTYLLFIDSGCNVLIVNDDCAEGDRNSCLSLDLAAGEYFIGANSYHQETQGAYTLSVDCPNFQPCTECEVGTIACGQTRTGELGESLCRLAATGAPVSYHRLEIAAETEVEVRLRSTAIDPFLAIADSKCRVVASNDDCDRVDLNSCVRTTLAPGSYFVGASSALVGESGAYELSVACAGGGGGQIPGNCVQDGGLDISDGICILGFLFLGQPSSLPCGEGGVSNPGNLLLADFDGNSRVELTDGVAVFLYLFNGGAPPALGTECVAIAGCPEVCTP